MATSKDNIILNDILNLYQVRNLNRNFDNLKIFSIRPMENKWLLIKKYGIEYQIPVEF